METLILLFHPDYDKSRANRALAEAASSLTDVSVLNMGELYRNGEDIDLNVEFERLCGAQRIILQFPIQWYSTPPLLKAWQDTVLTRIFYIKPAEEGARLRNLPMMVAATAGNVPEAYTPEGINLFPLEELLKPLHATAHRCGWRWCKPFLLYWSNKLGPEELQNAGRRYVEQIKLWQNEVGFEQPRPAGKRSFQ